MKVDESVSTPPLRPGDVVSFEPPLLKDSPGGIVISTAYRDTSWIIRHVCDILTYDGVVKRLQGVYMMRRLSSPS